MEINMREIVALSAPGEYSAEPEIRTGLKIPPGLPDAAKVLFVTGEAHIAGAEAAAGCILTDGSVAYTVVYADVEGGIYSFASQSGFRATVSAPEVAADAFIYTDATAPDVEWTLSGGRDIYIESTLYIRAAAVSNLRLNTAGSEGAISRKESRELVYIKEERTKTATLRTEAAIEGTEAVYARGHAVVESAVADDDAAGVTGFVAVEAMIKTESGLLPYTGKLAFSELIPMPGLLATDRLRVFAEAGEVTLAVAQGEGRAEIETLVYLRAAAEASRETEITTDLYSQKTELVTETAVARIGVASYNAGVSCDSAATAESALSGEAYAAAEASLTSVRALADSMEAEGIVTAYVLSGGECERAELPFAVTLPLSGAREGDRLFCRCRVRRATATATGGMLTVAASLDFDVQGFREEELTYLGSCKDTGNAVYCERGVFLYFARGGESLYDVAKKYLTSEARVAALNPDAGGILMPGEKLLIHN